MVRDTVARSKYELLHKFFLDTRDRSRVSGVCLVADRVQCLPLLQEKEARPGHRVALSNTIVGTALASAKNAQSTSSLGTSVAKGHLSRPAKKASALLE